MVTSFSGGGSWSTRREPPTTGKQLVLSVAFKGRMVTVFFMFTTYDGRQVMAKAHMAFGQVS
jgi:hypothetical protein